MNPINARLKNLLASYFVNADGTIGGLSTAQKEQLTRLYMENPTMTDADLLNRVAAVEEVPVYAGI